MVKSPKATRVEIDITPVIEDTEAAKLRMMNDYTTRLIPNIIRESQSTTKEEHSNKFYPKVRERKSTIRDHFSSGEYTSNVLKVKENFRIKNLKRIKDWGNKKHQASFISTMNPWFDILSHKSYLSPIAHKNSPNDIMSEKSYELCFKKVHQGDAYEYSVIL